MFSTKRKKFKVPKSVFDMIKKNNQRMDNEVNMKEKPIQKNHLYIRIPNIALPDSKTFIIGTNKQ